MSDVGVPLAVTQAGEGSTTVVLIHGWSCQRRQWAALLAEPPAGVTLLAVDLPGHGDSAALELAEWSVVNLATVLVQTLRREGVDNPILVGHSMGGAVAMEAARIMAAKAVVLVDTFVIPYGDLDETTAQGIEQPFKDDFVAAMAALVENNVGPGARARVAPMLREEMAGARQDAMLPLWADLLRWSPEPAFSDITCPIHAINGDLIGEAAKVRCMGRVTTCHQIGAWHFPQLENPPAFRALLEQALSALA